MFYFRYTIHNHHPDLHTELGLLSIILSHWPDFELLLTHRLSTVAQQPVKPAGQPPREPHHLSLWQVSGYVSDTASQKFG